MSRRQGGKNPSHSDTAADAETLRMTEREVGLGGGDYLSTEEVESQAQAILEIHRRLPVELAAAPTWASGMQNVATPLSAASPVAH